MSGLVVYAGMFVLSIFIAVFLAMNLAIWLWSRFDGHDRRPLRHRGMFDKD